MRTPLFGVPALYFFFYKIGYNASVDFPTQEEMMRRKFGFGLIVMLLIVALGCSLGGLIEGVQEAGEQAQELVEEAEDLAVN